MLKFVDLFVYTEYIALCCKRLLKEIKRILFLNSQKTENQKFATQYRKKNLG